MEGKILKIIENEDQTIQKIVDQEVSRFNIVDQNLSVIKNKYSGLKINSLHDKENYEIIKEGVKSLKNLRSELEKKRKSLKNPFIEIGRGIDNYAKKIDDQLIPILTNLNKEKKVFEDLLKEEAERKEREEREELDKRVKELKSLGLNFDGELYVYGNISLDITSIKKMEIDRFEELKIKLTFEKKRIEEENRLKEEQERKEREEREEQERKAKEEREKIEKEKQALELKKKEAEDLEKKLEADRKKILVESELLKKELLELKKEQELRKNLNELIPLGFLEDFDKKIIYYPNTLENLSFSYENISDITDFDAFKAKTIQKISGINLKLKQLEEKKEKEKKELSERISFISNMGFTITDNFIIYKENKFASSKILQENLDKDFSKQKLLAKNFIESIDLKLKKEKEEQEAQKPDFEKIREYLTALNNYKKPEVSTEKAKQILFSFVSAFENMIVETEKTLE